MTDVVSRSGGRLLREGCRSPVMGARYSGLGLPELKHSKSDDLMLQSAPTGPPEICHGISEANLQLQRDACVVYEEDLGPGQGGSVAGAAAYFSDSEILRPPEKPPLKITGDFPEAGSGSKRASQLISLYDRVDPEDSIKDIISENDFYRFVLFKRHYEKYLDISKKYEEARNIAYYLEEKYHEIKAERDSLAVYNEELERRLERKDSEMHEKEDELFLQLEKAIRLEEDCEKLKAEKEKILEIKDKLEKEKNEAYRQLKLQADESEATRRRLECARNDVVKQVTAIVAEKDSLEKENARLKDALKDIERKSCGRRSNRSIAGLEKEVNNLKLVAKQSATLNSQLKKGMKHLASCRRRKCSVCSYTRATFGEYHSARGAGNLLSCFQSGSSGGLGGLHEKRGKHHSLREHGTPSHGCSPSHSSSGRCTADRDSDSCTGTPDLSLRLSLVPHNMSYIDEDSSSDEDPHYAPTVVSETSTAPHAFSSDSGFSSELCDPSPAKSFTRATKWTSSFRKLIKRVSNKKQPPSATS